MGEHGSLNFDNFPREMSTEFLIRLAVRDLASATSVCKAWNSIINSSEFIELHLKHSTKHPGYLNYSFGSKLGYFLDSRTLPLAIDEKIVEERKIGVGKDRVNAHINSSGGLLACKIRHENFCSVCNPFTGEEIQVSIGPFGYDYEKDGYINWCGLGYSVASNEYKILLLAHTKKKESQYVCKGAIYTLGAGSEWREIPGDIPFHICCPALDFEGSLFWLVCYYDLLHGPKFIASFDVESESFKLWKSPPNANMHVKLTPSQMISLNSIGGAVALSEIKVTGNNWVVKIWMLRDEVNETWVNDINIEMPIFRHRPLKGMTIIGECAHPPSLLLSFNSNELVLYDIETDCHKFLTSLTSYNEGTLNTPGYIPHIQSFVSPNHIMTKVVVPKEV